MPLSSVAARPLPLPRRALSDFAKLLPGLFLVAAISALANAIANLIDVKGLSPMMLGILLGCALCNLRPLPKATAPGLRFASKTLLRLAVALLGLQITLGQLAGLGASGLALSAIVLFASFGFCLWVGGRLGIGRELTLLIASGTSVCGAAAIAGVNGSLDAREEEVTYAISTITLFGGLSMLAAPLLGALFGLSPEVYGQWVGLSLHEVANVVGAGFQGGELAGQTAVIVKLSRVLLLAPLILLILALPGRPAPKGAARAPIMPWFIGAFLLLCAANSTGLVPAALKAAALGATPVLMTAALTALGLGTDFRKLGALGAKPLMLGAAGTLFISTFALLLLGLVP